MMSSDAAKVNSSCCGGSGSGSGGESKRRRTEITLENSDENNSTDALLELGKERLKAAQAEMALAHQNVMDLAQNLEDIRQQIRSSGRYEVDSLLRLSHDDLFHIMCYLHVNDIGRCAMVCHALNNQTEKCWESFEARLLTHNSLRSPSATNSRERVTRYYNASHFATQIGALGENISKHTIISRQNSRISSPWYGRVDDHCTGCNMPDLNIDIFDDGVLSDEYELFVRLSRSSDTKLFTEGFVSNDRRWVKAVSLNGLDFSAWPESLELKRIMISLGDEFGDEDHYTLLRECMNELIVVLMAVNKTTLKPSLIAVHSGFSDIDIDRELGYVDCYPTGNLSMFSHRPFHGERMVQVQLEIKTWEEPEWEWGLLIEVMSGYNGEKLKE